MAPRADQRNGARRFVACRFSCGVVKRYGGPVVGLRETTPTVFVALGPSQNWPLSKIKVSTIRSAPFIYPDPQTR
jgi:hypothetical protein